MYSRFNVGFSALLVALAIAPSYAGAQAPAAGPAQRLSFTAWGGGFTDMGGFSQGDDFFQFDGTVAFGAGLHYNVGGGLTIGVDGLMGSPDYTRYDRDEGIQLGTGTGDVLSVLASGRLQGSPGPIGIFLTGGAGLFSWDVAEIGSNSDIGLTIGIGGELRLQSRISVFAEYGAWWVYHEKDGNTVTNTARHTLIRGGGRIAIF